jgi:hypothetical protein
VFARKWKIGAQQRKEVLGNAGLPTLDNRGGDSDAHESGWL